MKQILMIALFAIATGTSAFASPNSVSKKVTTHFSTAFKNAKNVSWKADGNYDKVSFMMEGQKVEAFYNKYGELIGTSKTAAFDKLPKKALEVITTLYTFPDYQLKDCIEFTSADKEKNYYVSFRTGSETTYLQISEEGYVSNFTPSK